MGYTKYAEDNMEIIEERRDSFGTSNGVYDMNYNYNNMIARARSSNNKSVIQSEVKKNKGNCFIIIHRKRMAK